MFKKFNELDYILKLFNSTDPFRENMRISSLIDGGVVVSTDGEAICQVKKSEVEFEYNKEPDFPDVRSVIDRYSSSFQHEKATKIHIKELLSVYLLATISSQYDNCSRCSGSGVEVCECCDNEGNCDSCRGTGYGKELPNAVVQFNSPERITITDHFFSFKNIDRIIRACKYLNLDSFMFTPPNSYTNPSLFKIGKSVELIIMPMSRLKED